MACTRLLGSFLHGTLLHHCHARRDTDHNAWTEDNTAPDHLFDKEAQHTLRNVIVRNNAVAQGTDRDNVTGRTPDHLPCLLTDGEYLIRVAVDRDY